MQITLYLSIHAPTRGATSAYHTKNTIAFLSIHAPTRGATSCSLDVLATYKLSIHAPTRGATAKMHNIPYASLQ